MRSASSVTASTGAHEYASLIRIALNENPRMPMTAHAGPTRLTRAGATGLPIGLLIPAHQSRVRGAEDHQAKRDPVPRERHEVVVCDVAQQPPHHEQGAREGNDKADADHRQVAGGQKVAVPYQLVAGGGEQGRYRQEERELRRSRARKAKQHSADDGRTGARSSGNKRERLRYADLERIAPSHLVDAFDFHGRRTFALPPLRPQNHESADDESRRDRHRREKMGLDRVAER